MSDADKAVQIAQIEMEYRVELYNRCALISHSLFESFRKKNVEILICNRSLGIQLLEGHFGERPFIQ